MTVSFKQVIENIRGLSVDERALIAHCLISSLESQQDADVDEAWTVLAEKRFLELETGAAKGVTWHEIKEKVKGKDA